MRYSDWLDWATDVYTSLSYDPLPAFSPGPASDTLVQKVSAGMIVFMTWGGGAGQTTEGLFDQPFLNVRAIGKQQDYDSAEKLAWDFDNAILGIDEISTIGTARVQPPVRSGGAPALIMADAASRYHFTCSYVVETASRG